MTLRVSLAAGIAIFLVAAPAPGAPQRARVHAEASTAAASSDAREERQAVSREQRTAAPRPAREEISRLPVAASIAAPTISRPSAPVPARITSSNGPADLTPADLTPADLTPADLTPADRRRDRDDDDRHHRNSRHDHSDKTVFVPVYVPVAVPVEVVVEGPVLTYTEPGVGVASVSNPATNEEPEEQVPPSYVFRPWFDVGPGLVAGVPFVLPRPETFEEGNSSPLVLEPVADASAASVTAVPLEYARGIGGVAFNVDPGDAAVYVDGYFVGSVDDYADGREPLLLKFGAYSVELRAKGYVTEKFPVYVTMGEVIPFRGKLVRLER